MRYTNNASTRRILGRESGNNFSCEIVRFLEVVICQKSLRVTHLKTEVLDASKIQQYLSYKNSDHNALQRES